MGTSTRKTLKKIGDRLKKALIEDPTISVDEIVPEVSQTVLRARKTKSYFSDKEFYVAIGGGLSAVKRIKEIGLPRYYEECSVKRSDDESFDITNLISAILDRIEEENGDFESSLILNAFQVAVSRALLDENMDEELFLADFCKIFISMIIREGVSENMLDAFENSSRSDIDSSVDKFAVQYVAEHYSVHIKKLTNGDINVTEFIKCIMDEIK